jgi:hypothetical protein
VKGQNPFAGGGSGLLPPATPFGQVQWFIDPYDRNPYSMQWNLGVQHQFNEAQVLSVNYVGSGSRRTNVGGYYNVALTPGPGDVANTAVCSASVTNACNPRALYPYVGPTFYDRSIGKADYEGLQVQYERRFSKGLAYQVAYTWSKSLDYGSSGWYGVEGQSVSDPYHIQRDRSVSGYDLTHVFSVNLVYALPIGKGKAISTGSAFADYVLGNWQLNSIFLARSGLPYQVYDSNDVANTGNVGWTQYERANLVGDPNAISNRSWAQYFNASAFAIPAQYTFGNLGRDALRTDPSWNLDFSLFRAFPIKEKMRFEFRVESFNLPNTVIYGTPNNDLASPSTFGQMTSTANHARQLQFGGKLFF